MDTPDIVTLPTWGYWPDGEAQIFPLAPGESLPDGWSASPSVITDPARATAEALTDRAAGRAYPAPPVEAAPVSTVPDAMLAEIERLNGIIATGMAENEGLIAEITKAEDLLDAAAADVATMRAALAKAEADGVAATAARDEAHAAIASVSADAAAAIAKLEADLAEARKDLEAATAPKVAQTGKAK